MFWGGGGGPYQFNPKFQDLSKSEFFGEVGEGGWSIPTQPSAKICPNLNVLGSWGDGPYQLNPKCQDLSKSEFFGEVGVVHTNSTQSAKICPNLNVLGRWGVHTNSTQSAKICPNLNVFGSFGRWGGGPH